MLLLPKTTLFEPVVISPDGLSDRPALSPMSILLDPVVIQ